MEYILVIKYSQVISHVDVQLKTNVSIMVSDG